MPGLVLLVAAGAGRSGGEGEGDARGSGAESTMLSRFDALGLGGDTLTDGWLSRCSLGGSAGSGGGSSRSASGASPRRASRGKLNPLRCSECS